MQYEDVVQNPIFYPKPEDQAIRVDYGDEAHNDHYLPARRQYQN